MTSCLSCNETMLGFCGGVWVVTMIVQATGVAVGIQPSGPGNHGNCTSTVKQVCSLVLVPREFSSLACVLCAVAGHLHGTNPGSQ